MKNKKLHILIINDEVNEFGGAAIYVFNIRKQLEKRGHIVKILGSDAFPHRNISNLMVFKSFRKSFLLRLFFYIFNPSSFLAVKKIIKDFKPDIVHIHNFLNYASPSILLPLKGIPTIATVHEYKLICPRGDLTLHTGGFFNKGCIKCVGKIRFYPETLKYFILSKFIDNIDIFVAPSNYMKNLLDQCNYPVVKVLNNGVTENSHFEIKNYQNILYVGNLIKIKGVDYLLKAIPGVIKRYPNVRFTIIGDGPERENLEKLARELGISEMIKFLGHVNNSELEEYYRDSTIVVFPSISTENLPTVIIEAMFSGRAVVASNVGGVNELVVNNETGFLLEPRNHTEISQKIIEALSDKKMIEIMGIKAASLARIKFNNDKHIHELENLYQVSIEKYAKL